jgi:hypothetical protein
MFMYYRYFTGLKFHWTTLTYCVIWFFIYQNFTDLNLFIYQGYWTRFIYWIFYLSWFYSILFFINQGFTALCYLVFYIYQDVIEFIYFIYLLVLLS